MTNVSIFESDDEGVSTETVSVMTHRGFGSTRHTTLRQATNRC